MLMDLSGFTRFSFATVQSPAEALVNALFKTTEIAVPVEGIGAAHVILRCFSRFTFSTSSYRYPGNS
uniref:Uncharacterized protein n=1 Tax=mine drainage metagenome TaxID=410659 RepID=E6QX77_9ZZZZ